MAKQYEFPTKGLPYLLVLPADGHRLRLLLLAGGPGGLAVLLPPGSLRRARVIFVGLENYTKLFTDPDLLGLLRGLRRSSPCSVAFSSMAIALFLAVQANKKIRCALLLQDHADLALRGRHHGRRRPLALHVQPQRRRHRLVPQAQASASSGTTCSIRARPSSSSPSRPPGSRSPTISSSSSPASRACPPTLVEAAAIDGAGPIKRFWKIIFPLLSPTTFYLLVMNLVYGFFETFPIIHQVTAGRPGQGDEHPRLQGLEGRRHQPRPGRLVRPVGHPHDPRHRPHRRAVPLHRAESHVLRRRAMIEQSQIRAGLAPHLCSGSRSSIIVFPI